MSSVIEIQAEIEKLTPAEKRQLEDWFAEMQARCVGRANRGRHKGRPSRSFDRTGWGWHCRGSDEAVGGIFERDL